MKNTDIQKIRQFIKNWQNETKAHLSESRGEEIFCEIILIKCDSLFALLPCETCNGTGRKIIFRPGQREFGGDASTSYEIPCPDCQ